MSTVYLTHSPGTDPASDGWTDKDALACVADRLSLEVIEEILEGGSSARVYKTRAGDGAFVAVKVLVEQPGVVDGHDLASFQNKLVQIDKIRAEAPELGARYLPVLHSIDGGRWAAYTTPYFESEDTAACLREPGGEPAFFRQYNAIIGDLLLRGYAVDAVPAPPGYLADVHVGRFLRRFPILERSLPAELVAADELVVNGRLCQSPRVLLQRLLHGSGPRLERMAPAQLMFPAHGDANTRNILVRPGSGEPVDFRIIDPRGSTDYWDPVYDLAKALFSLSVWDPALRLGLAIRRSRPGQYEVGFRCPVYEGYRVAIHRFLPYLEKHTELPALFEKDPQWNTRLLLTHDLHVLAEAPCRLSDLKPKWDCRGAESSPATLAVGHYLLGALLVNDLAEQLAGAGELDADRHLRLVTGDLPTG
jgi:hypothetical protein